MSTAAIYVDIDDTLVRSVGTKRNPVPATIAMVRELRARGISLYAWSTGGADYARTSAAELGIESCFVAFLPKPTVLIDDRDFATWRVREVHPAQCAGITASELLGDRGGEGTEG